MTIYNLKSDGDQYRITKFTNDLDVESSYLLDEQNCECPAGSRSTCRHRQMLPTMLAEGLCDSGGFYDFDQSQVLIPAVDALEMEALAAEDIEDMPDGLEKDYQHEMQELEPQTFETLDDLANAIEPHSTVVSATESETVVGGSNPPEAANKPHPTIGHIKRRI